MSIHESKAKIATIHIPKATRRALTRTAARRGSIVVRHARKGRKKARIVSAPLGEAGVVAAARRAGIRLSGPFGL